MTRPIATLAALLALGCATTEVSSPAARPRPLTLAYQLDVSRDKVPTMASLRRLVDILADLGYDELQLYTEHVFAYAAHESVWRFSSPMTPAETRELDDYCAARGVALVPNQNTFGHMERWLKHPQYRGLAERPEAGGRYPRWGAYVIRAPRSLCPTDPRSLEFVAGLLDELLPCFRAPLVNVGCDEVLELEDPEGKGRSAAALAERGAAAVYLDYLVGLEALCSARSRRMMFWGDMVLRHPELLPQLPPSALCLDWGYEADHPFLAETALLKTNGVPFRVCPGTSAWGSLSGRFANMTGNVDAAVDAALANGADGVLLADWGDGGHPNPLLVSLPAIVYTAYRVRGMKLTRAQLAAAIDEVVAGRGVGEAIIAYGGVYAASGGRQGNSTELYHLLVDGADYRRGEGVSEATLAAARSEWRAAAAKAAAATAPDWVRDDFELLALLYRAVEVRLDEGAVKNFRARFESEYRRLWLKSNRPGGLDESLLEVFGK